MTWTKEQTLKAAESYWRQKPGLYAPDPQLISWYLLFEWAAMS